MRELVGKALDVVTVIEMLLLQQLKLPGVTLDLNFLTSVEEKNSNI